MVKNNRKKERPSQKNNPPNQNLPIQKTQQKKSLRKTKHKNTESKKPKKSPKIKINIHFNLKDKNKISKISTKQPSH